MLNSILLYLDGAQRAEAVIHLGVELARRHEARVRGLSLQDTRRMQSLTANCEAAVYAVSEQQRMRRAERQQVAARAGLSQACLSADLNFDVRRLSGDPFEVLPHESRFHDLVIAAYPEPQATEVDDEASLGPRELVELAFRGVQPLLVVRRKPQPMGRVLLVYDGTPAAGRAIRAFLSQSPVPDAEHRLLAVGESERSARDSLAEMSDYLHRRRMPLETGWISGSPRRVLVPYAQKWQADLVVLGAAQGNTVIRRLFGETAHRVLCKLTSALYIGS